MITTKKTIALLLITCLLHHTVFACTTFVLKANNSIYFGRNLDWVSDLGLVVVNKRGTSKKSFVFAPEKSIDWVSKYGSITFNQFGKEFPYGGINETGLVIEIMVSEAEYPTFDERPVVNELQWIQYQLDNCSTVDEVLANDSKIRISQAHENLHYLICDGNGSTAVVEFLDGKMVYYKGDDLPVAVLENESYNNSLKGYNNKQKCRFTTAADLVKKYNGSLSGVDYAFNILEKVALSAEWSIVYDITKKQIHFRTNTHENIRIIDLNSFDFACNASTLSYDMSSKDKGDITKDFAELSPDANLKVVKKALEINAVTLEKEQSNQLFDYFKLIKCTNE